MLNPFGSINLFINKLMGGSESSGGGGGNDSSDSSSACERAQAKADAICSNCDQVDHGMGSRFAGGDLISNGVRCSQAQDEANKVCGKK